MRKTFILFLFISISLPTSSQVNYDSLWNEWQDKSVPDSMRINALKKIIYFGYMYSKPDSAFHYLQLQYDFADSIGSKKYMADAIGSMGNASGVKGDYSKALDYYMRCIPFVEETKDSNGTAATLNNIGTIYMQQGNYSYALDYFERSLKLREEMKDTVYMQEPLTNIGNIYGYMKEYDKSQEYYSNCLKIAEMTNNQIAKGMAYGNMAINYNEQGYYDEALEYFQKALKIFEEQEFPDGISESLMGLGECYSNKKNFPQALIYFKKSLIIDQERGDKSGISQCYINLGNIYNLQKKYTGAINECINALEISRETGAINIQRDACECLYNAYKGIGNNNEALVYHEQMLKLDDSLKAEETVRKLAQIEFNKQVLADSVTRAEEERLAEEAFEAEISKGKQTRNLYLFGGIFFVILSGALYSRWRYVRKSRDEISKEKDRSENLLLNILPAEVAQELKEKGRTEARDFDMVSILFTDFVTFTETSEKLSASELVVEINTCFEAFDSILEKYNVEKIKTIGDAYMAAGGLPIPDEKSAKNTVLAALEMQEFINNRKEILDTKGQPAFEMRIGIHTGPVVVGIVGLKKFHHDIWGDTVNTASRMESSGEAGKVNISRSTYDLIKNDPGFTFENRGMIDVKGKGEIEMYFVMRSSLQT